MEILTVQQNDMHVKPGRSDLQWDMVQEDGQPLVVTLKLRRAASLERVIALLIAGMKRLSLGTSPSLNPSPPGGEGLLARPFLHLWGKGPGGWG